MKNKLKTLQKPCSPRAHSSGQEPGHRESGSSRGRCSSRATCRTVVDNTVEVSEEVDFKETYIRDFAAAQAGDEDVACCDVTMDEAQA
jgi:hypothetical protein